MTEARRALAIPSLDGVRAVSIGLVFAGHVGFDFTPGGFGVTVFFVLSGYLITTLLRLEHERTQTVSLKHFYARRAFRIWPAFYALLVIAAVCTALFGLGFGRVDSLPLIAEFGHFWNYFSIFYKGPQRPMPGTEILWSLAVEEHFYFVLPLMFIVMNRFRMALRRQAIVLISLAVAVVVWRCILVYGLNAQQPRTYFATDTRADALFLGCAMALWANPVLDSIRQSSVAIRNQAMGGVIAILASLSYRNFEFREGFRYTIQAAGVVLILRYVIAAPKAPVGRVLNTPIMAWLGQLSYPFYLIHYIVVLELFKHISNGPVTGRAVVAIIAAPLSLALAWCLQSALMDPATRFRQRVIDPKLASQKPATVSTG